MSCQRARVTRVAEPLVRQLVRHQSLRAPVVAAVVAAEGRQPLRLQRDLEVVGGDDHGVGRERVGPEPLDEPRHHLGLPAERGLEAVVDVRPGPTATIGTEASSNVRSW